MNTVVDIEKAKLLAERINELKKEASSLTKELKELFKDTNVEVEEILSDGTKLVYKQFKTKPKFDYKSFVAYLLQAVKKGIQYDDNEIDNLLEQFKEERPEKWALKIIK
ncbi:hypothetical protein [Mycoplasmopsis alligatoris]|uniref:Uncharacterized protein n=1 Tax=Mycoplasmopsis alligatoris A21JP2 TaxID=747682 RepID=D4XW99_9BACT|nr:hypothetical protein [Mycoplasmopsis alligatoris]EFF41377.1 conserved hypothetical protein [Mycoplasmopsis alligatoris A21JP2]